MVISAAALLTIVAGIAPLAIPIGGVGAPVAYALADVVLGIFAVAFMAMTRYVKALGGFYTYIAHALGKEIGLGSSLIALVACNALQIGLYGLLGAQAHDLVKKELGINVPWWLIAIIGVLAVFIVAHRGIDIGARVLGVLLVAESLILAIFAVAVLVQGGADGITFGTFSLGALFNPGMLAILVFAQATRYLGPWAELATYVVILTSVYASQLAFHNAINRYTYSFARDGVLPRSLHHTGAKTGSPYASGILQAVLSLIVIVIVITAALNGDPYLQLLLWVNSPGVLGTLFLQVIMCIAVVVFFVRHGDLARKWFVIPCAVVAGAAMLTVLIVVSSSINLLTAGGAVVNTIVLVAVPVTFLTGVVLARMWKRTCPQIYAAIGGASEMGEIILAASIRADVGQSK